MQGGRDSTRPQCVRARCEHARDPTQGRSPWMPHSVIALSRSGQWPSGSSEQIKYQGSLPGLPVARGLHRSS